MLVENEPGPLQTVAAYIDLNAVRAGLVQDPKDYRFCGDAAAVAGQATLRSGLMSCLQPAPWASASAEYRRNLFVTAHHSGSTQTMALDRPTILAELARGAPLSLPQVLRVRVRHFTDGLILGSRRFVNHAFLHHRDQFGPKRQNGARSLRGVPLPSLSALRDLQSRTVA